VFPCTFSGCQCFLVQSCGPLTLKRHTPFLQHFLLLLNKFSHFYLHFSSLCWLNKSGTTFPFFTKPYFQFFLYVHPSSIRSVKHPLWFQLRPSPINSPTFDSLKSIMSSMESTDKSPKFSLNTSINIPNSILFMNDLFNNDSGTDLSHGEPSNSAVKLLYDGPHQRGFLTNFRAN
jgi:hypothetical protein